MQHDRNQVYSQPASLLVHPELPSAAFQKLRNEAGPPALQPYLQRLHTFAHLPIFQ